VSFSVDVDALACIENNRVLCILSASGNERTICRMKAVLQSNAKVQMWLRGEMPCPFSSWSYRPLRHEAGYAVYRHKLDYDQWHMLAVAKHKGLLPAVSDEALWQELRSERYTTPLLRSWVPWLREQMVEEGHLQPLQCFQCQASCVSMTHDELDDLVSVGIQNGYLSVA
jgi:hypothetical protein